MREKCRIACRNETESSEITRDPPEAESSQQVEKLSVAVFHDTLLSSSPNSLLRSDHDQLILCLIALGAHVLLRSSAVWKRGSISAFIKRQSAHRALLAVR